MVDIYKLGPKWMLSHDSGWDNILRFPPQENPRLRLVKTSGKGDASNQTSVIGLDMHCHSTQSDGKNTPDEIIEEAKRKNLVFLTLTDHDAIASHEFQQKLQSSGIETCDSVEVSAKGLHLVSYARRFHKSLHDVLDNTRNGKVKRYEGQIQKLLEYWFEWSIEWFSIYMQERHGRWLKSANIGFLVHYLYTIPTNRAKMLELVQSIWWNSQNVISLFYWECLKRKGAFYDKYWYESEEYEPSVETTVDEVVSKAWWLVSMAHPNVTFWGNKWWIPEFERTISDYIDKWVQWVEVNARAWIDWIEVIMRVQRKYNIILTFWSDYHGKRDDTHWNLWEQNPYITPMRVRENYERLQSHLW